MVVWTSIVGRLGCPPFLFLSNPLIRWSARVRACMAGLGVAPLTSGNVMSISDIKHTNAVKLWLTDREFLDLSRLAASDDRKVSEMVRVMVRAFMYGHIGTLGVDAHGANSADEGLQ